jgi:hypothetical protein
MAALLNTTVGDSFCRSWQVCYFRSMCCSKTWIQVKLNPDPIVAIRGAPLSLSPPLTVMLLAGMSSLLTCICLCRPPGPTPHKYIRIWSLLTSHTPESGHVSAHLVQLQFDIWSDPRSKIKSGPNLVSDLAQIWCRSIRSVFRSGLLVQSAFFLDFKSFPLGIWLSLRS